MSRDGGVFGCSIPGYMFLHGVSNSLLYGKDVVLKLGGVSRRGFCPLKTTLYSVQVQENKSIDLWAGTRNLRPAAPVQCSVKSLVA